MTDLAGEGVLQDLLRHTAQSMPNRVALTAERRRVAYAELDAWSTALANALARRGVHHGDRVVCLLETSIEAVIAFWGVLKANAIAVPIHSHTKSDRLAFVLHDCQPCCMIVGGELVTASTAAHGVRSLRTVLVCGPLPAMWSWDADTPEVAGWAKTLPYENTRTEPRRTVGPDDVGALFYECLGTPEAHAVMLSHRAMAMAARAIAANQAMAEQDVVFGWLPMSFDFGLYQTVAAATVGARVVVEKSGSSPEKLVASAAAEGVTVFPSTPSFVAALSDSDPLRRSRLTGVRYVAATGTATPVKHLAALHCLFPRAEIHSSFGFVECRTCTHMTPALFVEKPGSVGVPWDGTRLWLEDDAGEPVPSGAVGMLVIDSPCRMSGYWRLPERTARALRPGGGRPLVLHTGERCRMDPDGFLYLVGHGDETAGVSGAPIATHEIEEVLLGISGVKEAAVIGVRDAVFGRVPKAYVTFAQSSSLRAGDVERICRERLADEMVPRDIEIWRTLPKDERGSIDKRLLERVAGGAI